ncbi:MAG: hypothetical protein LBO72_10770 [Helicobacteraceae bacterium]|nr:hypothetical protein [Helicobacteraceae bacterium]
MPQNRRKPFAIAAVLIAVLIAATAAYFALCKDASKPPIIATGGAYSLVVIDGKLYAAGDNEYGQLGLRGGSETNRRSLFTPVPLSEDKEIIALAAGEAHSLALTSEGKVWATGANGNGQLGLGASYPETFMLVRSLKDKKIVALAASKANSLALTSEGRVYATGANGNGELGFGDGKARVVFTPVSSLRDKKIARIAAGVYCSFAIGENGDVYATGYNFSAQLGLGDDYSNRNVFTLVKSLEGKKIVAVAAGENHSLALGADGKVYAAGWNGNGQLGFGDDERDVFTEVASLSDKNVTQVAAGYRHSLALDSDGKVYATGDNGRGQLGLGYGGENDFGEAMRRKVFTLVSSLEGKKIVAVAAGKTQSVFGGSHSLALTSDGKLYATGANEFGQLGVGDQDDRNVFTLVALPDR